MKRSSKVAIVIVVLTVASLASFFMLKPDRVDDLPGAVIGNNPNNIPESKLPVCNFTGAEFIEEPCYSPPGSVYL